VADHVCVDRNPDAETASVLWHQQILGGLVFGSPWSRRAAVVDGDQTARIGEAMIAYLDELFAKLFGQRESLPIRVRADEESPRDKQLKGRK
jgi:hypothetical protein